MRYREIIRENDAARADDAGRVYTDPSRRWFHGSEDTFKKFDLMHVGKYRGNSPGFWFTDNADLTDYYGDILYEVRLKLRSVKVIAAADHGTITSLGKSAREARDEGYDALVVEDYMDGDRTATNACVFDQRRIKIVKAAPVE